MIRAFIRVVTLTALVTFVLGLGRWSTTFSAADLSGDEGASAVRDVFISFTAAAEAFGSSTTALDLSILGAFLVLAAKANTRVFGRGLKHQTWEESITLFGEEATSVLHWYLAIIIATAVLAAAGGVPAALFTVTGASSVAIYTVLLLGASLPRQTGRVIAAVVRRLEQSRRAPAPD